MCAAFADEDAHHLYVSPEEIESALAQRARIWLSAISGDQPLQLRAQAADTAARSLAEAEPELEKLVRSGYRTVVAFPRRGEGERAAYNLGRLKATWLGEDVDVGRQVLEPSLQIRGGVAARGFRRAPAASSRSTPSIACCAVAAPSARAARRGEGARLAAAGVCAGARCARSPSCAPATSSCTRITASRGSRASRRAPSRMSRATTCTSNTRATTACSCPPSSWQRSRATSAPEASTRRCPSSAARAGRR